MYFSKAMNFIEPTYSNSCRAPSFTTNNITDKQQQQQQQQQPQQQTFYNYENFSNHNLYLQQQITNTNEQPSKYNQMIISNYETNYSDNQQQQQQSNYIQHQNQQCIQTQQSSSNYFIDNNVKQAATNYAASSSSFYSYSYPLTQNSIYDKKNQSIYNKNDSKINTTFGIVNKQQQQQQQQNGKIKQEKLENTGYFHSTREDTFSEDSDLFRNGATLRERNRMHILNDAFDDLRKIVPKSNLSEHQRLSKIATLRLAIHYISSLTKLLQSSGGCKPVDPSLLPKPPKRKRRRKFAKIQDSNELDSVDNKNIKSKQETKLKKCA